ncbi:ATP-dependent DNA helicase RecG [Brachybacterium sillae]|uniref:ATP-dependent DNA helicase RecG n=1 Tax=Brachybacterium sillae TaxID=2810536 RepID=UPI00217E6AB7|nr:ATP-dependent DNA helicase RecG [Brachybacterium sillae]
MEDPTATLHRLFTPKELRAIQALGVEDLDELLRVTPLRYVVPGPLRALDDVRDGEEVSVIVQVRRVSDRPMRNRPGHLLQVRVGDDGGALDLTFFLRKKHQVAWHRGQLTEGRTILVRGTVERSRDGSPQIVHPEYEGYDPAAADAAELRRPQPVYPLRERMNQAGMRRLFATALEHAGELTDPLPEAVLRSQQLPPLAEALRLLHAPHSLADPPVALRRLAAEEAFVLQTIFARRRALDASLTAPSMTADGPLRPLVEQRLPFTLTAGQQEVGAQIDALLAQPHPTSVLLQGDVGSGKTVVALRAMLRAVDSGRQAVLLAPTEVLAAQHHRTIMELLGDLGLGGRLDAAPDATAVRLLTGSLPQSQRRQTLADILSGEAGLVIGTHALLTDTVEFASLGLVVIDEQHRFGVDHRRRLRSKGEADLSPHVIVMTATPIPRTAALATVGDLDVLSLREAPGRRAGMSSFVVEEGNPAWLRRMWERTAEEIAAGHRAFVVCPRIDETEDTTAGEDGRVPRGVVQTAARLSRLPALDGVRIGMLHGRMGAEEKRQAMEQLASGEVDLLVATTVVEVGVDVPEATVMIVLDAERFGVSQLHQLRGRVGRGSAPGIAFFETRAPGDSDTAEHLRAVAGTLDGFALAELDLGRRGIGDLVGTEQSGLGRTLRFLDPLRDRAVVESARTDAQQLVAHDPQLSAHPGLAAAIDRRLRDVDPDVERS